MINLGSLTEWTKSSYSVDGGSCVVVKSTEADTVRVGDSKFLTGTPEFSVAPDAFRALVGFVRV